MCFVFTWNMGTYRCDVCGKQFAREDNLAQHRKKHNLYQCTDCPQAFSTEHTLESHRYYRHNQSGRGKKRASESPQSGPSKKRRITKTDNPAENYRITPLGEQKCGNSTQRPTDIEFNFKIWKSGICLTSYKVCVASFPQ